MRRITAGICLVAGVVSTGVPPALSEEAPQAESALVDQASLPDAIELKGARPKSDPTVVAPAADARDTQFITTAWDRCGRGSEFWRRRGKELGRGGGRVRCWHT